jgi:glucan phosphoethanolaminetransferase (alkaline phosphatase superfamily)
MGVFSKIFYEIFLQNIIEKQVKTNQKQYKKHLTSRLLFSLLAALFPFYKIVYIGAIYYFNQYQIFILCITIALTYIVVLSFYSRLVDIIFEALFPNMPRSIFEVTEKDAATYITKEKTISKGALKRGCFFYLSLILLLGAGYLIILFK